MSREECRRGAHLPCSGREPAGGLTIEVCDSWQVRRQTYPDPDLGVAAFGRSLKTFLFRRYSVH